MARIVALLRREPPQQDAPGAVPSATEVADALASAMSRVSGPGWSIDVAVSAETCQVTVFGQTNDGARDFIVPITVGSPVVLNSRGSAACEEHHPPASRP